MADMEIKMDETNNSGSNTRLFTQDEVNKIVRERLARERQKSQVEEQPEDQPENMEETALPEIDETIETESKEELPEEISTMFGDIVLNQKEDIKAFREIFGTEYDGDERAMRDFLEWKAYAEAHGAPIQPVDSIEMAQWKEQRLEGHVTSVSGTVNTMSTLSERKVASTQMSPDALLRKIFGLPAKAR